MKRPKHQNGFCSDKLALALFAVAVTLLLMGWSTERHLTVRLSWHTAKDQHRGVRVMCEYPAFCKAVPPLPVARNRWPFQSYLNAPGPAAAAVHAAADAALAVYEAANVSQRRQQIQQAGKPEAAEVIAAHLRVVHAAARINTTNILQNVGTSPRASNAFEGRGIVIVGGGNKYTPPAFACVAFLRRAGCQLPIEVWAPPHEPIPDEVVPHFMAMKATVRQLADVLPQNMHHSLSNLKFVAKPAAILASSFKEVLLLDSDNIPLRDPSYLFQHELYTSSGLLMWPDFWDCQAKPAAWEALGIPPLLQPKGSHESGQIVIDKQRNWQPLLLSLYLNLRGDVFYPVLSDVGQGDKETLPYAYLSLAAASQNTSNVAPYGLVPHPVLALGVVESNGQHTGFAMVQRGPDGGALFLHAHMPKVDLRVDGGFEQRRWVNMTGKVDMLHVPEGLTEQDAGTYRVLNAVAGYDVEEAVHVLRQQLTCDPAWVECCL